MDAFQEILAEYWGYTDFRGVQREIIEHIASGHDTLGLMPTGGGKSMTFQVPSLAAEGTCIVITPLISLMRDQVRSLRRKGIKAVAVHTGMTHSQIEIAFDNCIYGKYKFLYVSPERLTTQFFIDKLKRMTVNLITVDESHCISQWGYDFRPTYLRISEIRQYHPHAPILALTATATPRVVEDIQSKLAFRQGSRVISMSFERKNLAYIVRECHNKEAELIHILSNTSGAAIVYTSSRKRTREVAQRLAEAGFTATHYHAGLHAEVRAARQEAWHAGEYRVIVATNAFGMGIDKADVRLVMHIDVPSSIEAYFQEAGRAGRDGNKSYAVLLHQNSDITTLHRRIADAYPPKEKIRAVYEHLCYFFEIAMDDCGGYSFEFDLDKFCRLHRFFPTVVEGALRILEQAGYLHYEEEPSLSSRLRFLIRRDDLYNTPLSKDADEMVQLALRLYPGLFTDNVFIQEEQLAHRLNTTLQDVYECLKALQRNGIVEYIPRKQMPFITLLQDRVEASELVIPKSIYEMRMEQDSERIEAMIKYITSEHTCRSILLLNYFGEKRVKPCGHCDVCLQNRKKSQSADINATVILIKRLLTDHEALTLPQIMEQAQTDRNTLVTALEYLLNEHEIIETANGFLLN